KIGGAMPAPIGILRNAPLDEPIECRRCNRKTSCQRRRVALEDRRYDKRLALSVERLFPGEHFVEHGPERKYVGARVGLLTFDLPRSHVLQGADTRTWRRQICRRQARWNTRTHRRSRFGQTEIEQLRATLSQHDIARFEIPMDDASHVSFIERRR